MRLTSNFAKRFSGGIHAIGYSWVATHCPSLPHKFKVGYKVSVFGLLQANNNTTLKKPKRQNIAIYLEFVRERDGQHVATKEYPVIMIEVNSHEIKLPPPVSNRDL